VSGPSSSARLSADAIQRDVLEQVQAEIQARLVALDARGDFADAGVFDDVYRRLRQAIAHEHPRELLLPDLLPDSWRPDLALRFSSHRRGPAAWIILAIKRRVLAPLMRWLFEYSLENFRKQDRLNIALMACLESLAAEQARLRLRVSALEAACGRDDGREMPGPAGS
jgi:hypothetical protein